MSQVIDTDYLLELYNQGLSDPAIANLSGRSKWAVSCWRRAAGLPPQNESSKRTSMERALNPEECDKMKRFLHSLTTLQDQHPGKKIDISVFIREYRKGGAA